MNLCYRSQVDEKGDGSSNRFQGSEGPFEGPTEPIYSQNMLETSDCIIILHLRQCHGSLHKVVLPDIFACNLL